MFLGDEELASTLAAIRMALVAGGSLAFETRNPSVREWEAWTPDRVGELRTADGSVVRWWREVAGVSGEFVTLESTSTLRFLAADALPRLLAHAGLVIDEQYGDWDRSPLSSSSPEIITVARRPS